MKSYAEYLSATILRERIPSRLLPAGECQSSAGKRCSLCYAVDLNYTDEVRLKDQALQEFWRENVPGISLQPIVPSPVPRRYRTVTKRKAFTDRDGKTTLGLIDPDEGSRGGSFNVIRCAIEPEVHNTIYAVVGSALAKPYATLLAQSLQYVIIKGEEPAVVFSVDEIAPGVVKAMNTLSKTLTHACKEVAGVFLYEDDSDGRYYMGDTSHGRLQRVHGKPDIHQRIGGRNFLYSPLSFTQVNPAIAGLMIDRVRQLLERVPARTLFDLYCGYGLFGLSLADTAKRVAGAELSPHAVGSAIANARRFRIANARFIKSDITSDALSSILRGSGNEDVVILDPPRNGPGEGVIEHIAASGPGKVLHFICNIDLMPRDVERWNASGYVPELVLPFDMFPGTPSIEVLVALKPRS